MTRRSTSVLLYWSPSINKALYEYCVTTSHKRGGATRQCKCVRGGKTSKETFIDFSVIFCFSFMLSFATRHPPPERLFLCVSYFYAFFAAFVIASGAPRRRTSKINAKLLIREFLHQITVKKVAASAVGIEGRYVKSTEGAQILTLLETKKSALVRAKLSFQYFRSRVLKLFPQAEKNFIPCPRFTFFHELVCSLFIRARNHSPRNFLSRLQYARRKCLRLAEISQDTKQLWYVSVGVVKNNFSESRILCEGERDGKTGEEEATARERWGRTQAKSISHKKIKTFLRWKKLNRA